MALHIRRLIRWVDPQNEVRLYRVLELHENLGIVCVFDCSQAPRDSQAVPEKWQIAVVEEAIRVGLAVLLETEDDPFRPTDISALTPRQRAACERSYQDIRQLVELYSVLALTERNVRGKAVSAACTSYVDTQGKTRERKHRTIWATLRRWWRGGMVTAALVPRYRLRGGTESPKAGARKPGRKPVLVTERPEWAGNGLLPTDISKLQKGFDRFRVKQRLPLELAYSRTLITYWPVVTLRPDGTVECTLPALGTAPSFDQWYYHGRKLLEDQDRERRDRRLRQLYGDRTFDNSMRPEMLSVSRLSEGPGWLCQYDATPFPINLVSEDDRSRIIGRPLVFTLVDVKTRMIFTPFVTLETESYGAAQRGLYEICRRHDADEEQVKGMPRELGLPQHLAVDRGPYMALDSDHLIAMLSVRIEQGRSYFPVARQLVEATHRMLELLLKELPGTYDWHPGTPVERHPALDGALTLSEFQRAVRLAVNYLNEWSEIEDYPFDADMVEANIRPYRLDLWEFCRGRRPGGWHVWPDEHLMLHLMPGGEATVTPKGLLYEGQYYTCERAVQEDWYGEEQRRRHLGRQRGQARRVPVARHWSLRDVLYLRLPEQRVLERCVLVDERSAWQGKTWADYNEWSHRQALAAHEEVTPRLQARLDLSDELGALSKTSKTATKLARSAEPGKSNSALLKDMGRNRVRERDQQRQQDLPATTSNPTAPIPPRQESPPTVRAKYGKLLRQVKETEEETP